MSRRWVIITFCLFFSFVTMGNPSPCLAKNRKELWAEIIEARKNKQYDKAMELTEQYCDLTGRDSYGCAFMMAKAHFDLGNYTKSMEHWEIAKHEAGFSNYYYVLSNMGWHFFRLYQLDKAISHFKKASEYATDDNKIQLLATISIVDSYLGNTAIAQQIYQNILQEIENAEKDEKYVWNYGNTYTGAGYAAYMLGFYNEAVEHYSKAIERQYKDSRQVVLSNSLARSGKIEEAKEAFSKANLARSSLIPIAEYYNATGDKEKVIEYLIKSYKEKKTDEAREVWQKWRQHKIPWDEWATLRDDPRFQALLGEQVTTATASASTTVNTAPTETQTPTTSTAPPTTAAKPEVKAKPEVQAEPEQAQAKPTAQAKLDQAEPEKPKPAADKPEARFGFKPRLFVLGIGVSRYAEPRLNLKYAAKDAKALAQTLRLQPDRIFDQIKVKVLTDEQVTRESILTSFRTFLGRAVSTDVVLIFIAGHGVKKQDTGSFFFLPHQASEENLITHGLSWYAMEEAVSSLRKRVKNVILVLDTCHAAALKVALRGVRVGVDLASPFTRKGFYTISAAQSHQGALESAKWGHGAFTEALLAGLHGQADRNQDRVIDVIELFHFTERRVADLTEGQQHPHFYMEGSSLPLLALP